MSSYQLMFPGVRSSLAFSGFGVKSLPLVFSIILALASRPPYVTSKVVPSVLASSVCWSLQFLISALTKVGGCGPFFSFTCSVMLWGGRDTATK